LAVLFRWNGKLKEMGLGGLAGVSLADAREKVDEARRVLASGKNPIEVRRAVRAEREAIPTFGAFADALAADLSHGFRNATHRTQ
jgi:Arm DNA-binding domain